MRVAGGLVVLVVLASCQRGQDRAIERVAEKAIAEHGREATVKIDRERGEITVDLGRAVKPAEWPQAVPFYPRAFEARAKAGGHRLTIATEDAVGEVAEFYRQELVKLGWSVEGSADSRWQARRGSERLEIRLSTRDIAHDTRAEIQYGAGPG
jgi:hypothetical protein